ncbi:hypothetical protein [Nigerium massiliense]|uniref:hypothetical protein n=1 Tax=Nigerium massiliense TaxID=1522317 RepID=UPI0011CAFE64|nr:hypothetical protein [Nigerium massiliense]
MSRDAGRHPSPPRGDRLTRRPVDPATPRLVVWTGVRSQAHVAYGASYLRALLPNTTGPIRLVVLGRGGFLGVTAVTDDDLARLLPHDPRLVLEAAGTPKAAPGEHLTYLAVGAPGIKPWLRLAATHPGRRFEVVVTDEGIGSYGTWRTRRDSWRREGTREPWATIRSVAVRAARKLLTTRPWPLYERHDGRWWTNEDVAAEFRRTADAGAANPADGTRAPTGATAPDREGGVSGDPAGTRSGSPVAVYLSQPWIELGVVDAATYVSHVTRVGQACERAGFRFVVRPHPVEDVARYADREVWAGSTPAELTPRIASAGLVLGATSTALLNLAAVHGRPALRVACPGTETIERELSRDQRALFDQFVGPCVAEADLDEAIAARGRPRLDPSSRPPDESQRR